MKYKYTKIFLLFLFVLLFLSGQGNCQTSFHWSEAINLTNLNTPADDFAPQWNPYENLLYFNSTVSGYSKFYITRRLDSSKFSNPELTPGDLNQSFNNQSYISFAGEDKAYLSSYRLGDVRPYINIFQTNRKKKAWSQPLPADSFRYDNFVSQPTISPDGTFMVFVTDIGSEHKDTDLWMAFLKENGTWGSFVPLNELNTTGNEITPYLASNDTLYFSSDGQEGPGGYDVFYSVRKMGIWQKPIPLRDINTKFNESDFIVLSNGDAIFASDRQGGKGSLDLYFAKKETKEREENKKYVPPAELMIASQISTIRSNSELTYKLMPVVPYYLTDVTQNHLILPNEFNLSVVGPTIDSIMMFTLPIIGERVTENPSTHFSLIPLYSEAPKSSDILKTAIKIKKYYVDLWSIDSNRITIEQPKQSTLEIGNRVVLSAIKFDSDNQQIFEPLDIPVGVNLITLDPPVVDVSVNARPSEIIKKWECNLFVNNKFVKLLSVGTTMPTQFSADLNPLKQSLNDADSIKIVLNVTDTLMRTYFKSIVLNLVHSENKAKELFKTNNKSFDEYYMFFTNKEPDQNLINQKLTIDRIIESGSYTNYIKISVFSQNLIEAAQQLQKMIADGINDKRVKIEVSTEDYKNSLPFSSKFADNVIRIWIEKQNVN